VRYRLALFWSVTGTVCAVSTAVALALPGNDVRPKVIGMRLIAAIALALMAGAASIATTGAVQESRLPR
jgi:hypothetical protein